MSNNATKKLDEFDIFPTTNDGKKDSNVVNYTLYFALVTASLFLIIWYMVKRKYAVFYTPRRQNGETKKIEESLGWYRFSPFLGKNNPKLMVEHYGVDGYIYMQTIELVIYIFFGLSVVALLSLIPLYGLLFSNQEGLISIEKFSIHPTIDDRFVFIPVIVIYIFTLVIYYMVFIFYQQVLQVRQAFLSQSNKRNMLLLIQNIPDDLMNRDRLVERLNIQGNNDALLLGEKFKKYQILLEKRKEMVKKLERIVMTFQKILKRNNRPPIPGSKPIEVLTYISNPNYEPEYRPKTKAGKDLMISCIEDLEGIQKYLSYASTSMVVDNRSDEALSEDAFTINIQSNLENNLYLRLNPLRFIRNLTFNGSAVVSVPQSSGPALLNTMIDNRILACNVSKVIEPSDIIWRNINLSFTRKWVRNIVYFTTVVFLIIFYSSPLFFKNQYQTEIDKFFNDLKDKDQPAIITDIITLIQGGLEPFFYTIIMSLAPLLLTALTIFQGAPSKHEVEMKVIIRSFYFQAFQFVLILFALPTVFVLIQKVFKTGFNGITEELIKGDLAGRKIGRSVNFLIDYNFLHYIALADSLLRPLDVLLIAIRRLMGSFTKRNWIDICKAFRPLYPQLYNFLLIEFLFLLCFSVCYPILLPLGLVYFSCFWIAHHHLFINRFISKNDTGGLHWPIVVDLIIFSVICLQLLTAMEFLLLGFYIASGFMFLTIFISISFKSMCHQVFNPSYIFGNIQNWHISSTSEQSSAKGAELNLYKSSLQKNIETRAKWYAERSEEYRCARINQMHVLADYEDLLIFKYTNDKL